MWSWPKFRRRAAVAFHVTKTRAEIAHLWEAQGFPVETPVITHVGDIVIYDNGYTLIQYWSFDTTFMDPPAHLDPIKLGERLKKEYPNRIRREHHK